MENLLEFRGNEFTELQDCSQEKIVIEKKLREENFQTEEKESLEERLHFLKEWMIPETNKQIRLKVMIM